MKFIFLGLLFALSSCHSGTSSDLRDRVRKITLDNGMTFLLVPRGNVPVMAIQLKVKVGNIEEEPGSSGMAHFFEHMAFKGTDKVGTSDFEKENKILGEVLKVGSEIVALKKTGKRPEDYAELLTRLKLLEAQENAYIEKNEYVQIFHRNGGRDLNASTSNDFTTYVVSLPSNKFEMWAYLESERLRNRVFREFFTEVDVVAEERRMRLDNSPDGRLYEAFNKLAFDRSPYKTHPVGLAEDIQHYTPAEAQAFYSRYYIPTRMVGVVVGRFDVDEAETVVRKYFSRLPKKEDVPKNVSFETLDATYPRSVNLQEQSQPRFFLGYHRPAHPHPDDIILDVVQDILCGGRTARLYKRLVIQDRSVAQVSCYASIPGVRLDGLFTFSAVPIGKHTNEEIHGVMKEEFAKLAAEGPTEKELEIIKNKIDAEQIYALSSNSGLASTLAFYESLTGDWRYMYDRQDRVHQLSAGDIQRVVKTYFVDAREVAAYSEMKK